MRTPTDATIRSYRRDFRHFATFATERGWDGNLPVDPLLIADYIAHQSLPDERPGRERSAMAAVTIRRRVGGVGAVHRLAGLTNPTYEDCVRDAMAGARQRLRGTRSHASEPLATDDLIRIVRRIPTSTHAGRRDRAMLLVGFMSALARSELVALDIEDVRFVANGILLCVPTRRPGTDVVHTVPVANHQDRAMCAVRALRAWLGHADIDAGPVFRRVRRGDRVTDARLGDRSVALILKKHAAAAGVNPTRLAGHSLRAGGIRAAAEQIGAERDVLAVARLNNVEYLRRYIRSPDGGASPPAVRAAHLGCAARA